MIDRRAFLRRAGAAAAALMGAPLVTPSRATAASDRLVVAVGQWGTETPFAWRSVQAEKPLWDCVYDPLIMRDPKTFEYRPGLATTFQPSNDLRTWTFKLRSGVKFHEGWASSPPRTSSSRSSKTSSPTLRGARRRSSAASLTVSRRPTSTP